MTRVFGFLFLAAQIVAGFYWLGARDQHVFITPYDGRTSYKLHVSIAGRMLGSDEISRRYHIPSTELAARTPEAIKSIVRHIEGTYQANDHAIVRLHFRLNGEEPEVWLWPES